MRKGKKVILVLTEEEYEALLQGKLKLRRDIKLRFPRFKINVKKYLKELSKVL